MMIQMTAISLTRYAWHFWQDICRYFIACMLETIYKHKSTRCCVLQAAAIAHLGGTEQNEVSHSIHKEHQIGVTWFSS